MTKMLRFTMASITSIMSIVVSASAADLTVCLDGSCDFDNVQGAIDAAEPGDTILVAAGTYVLAAPIDFGGKSLIVQGDVTDPSKVVFDAQASDGDARRVVSFKNGETADAVLEGVTITGGWASGSGNDAYGGGLYIANSSSPTIRNCVIKGNHADTYGGGLYIDGTNSLAMSLTDCELRSNDAARGGGAYAEYTTLTLHRVLVHGNEASVKGGGVYSYEGTLALLGSDVVANVAASAGGGLFLWVASTTIGPDPDDPLRRCRIAQNTAKEYGGGVFWNNYIFPDLSLTIFACDFENNTAQNEGGGLYLSGYGSYSASFDNCTLAGNSAGQSGGGLFVSSSNTAAVSLTNCSVSVNTATQNGGALCLSFGATVTITDCDEISGNVAGGAGGALYVGTDSNNATISSTVLCGNIPQNIFGDWTNGGKATDSAGCGDPTTITVGDKGDFATVQEAIGAAQPGDTIQIAPGTYVLDSPIDFGGRALLIRGDVTDPSLVVLDAQAQAADPRSVVIFENGETSQAILEGLTITGGWNSDGGGIFIGPYASPTIRHCIIEGNHADGYGGGVFIDATDSVAHAIIDCTVRGNDANYGGGLYSKWGTLSLQRVRFEANAASRDGGGISTSYQTLSMFGGSLISNTANGNGGGSYHSDGMTLIGRDPDNEEGRCRIALNRATLSGGGVYWSSGAGTVNALDIAECDFEENTATTVSGGGLRLTGSFSFSASLEDCVFNMNDAGDDGGAMAVASGFGVCALTIDSCRINQNLSGARGGGLFLEQRVTAEIEGECEYFGNVAGSDGGAIWIGRIENNTAISGAVFCGNQPNAIYGSWRGSENQFHETCGSIALPDLTVAISSVPRFVTLGEAAAVAWTTSNSGLGDTGGVTWSDVLFLSEDSTLDASDHVLFQSANVSGLDTGDSYDASSSFTLPIDGSVLPKTMYLFLVTDAFASVPEQSETNNASPGSAVSITAPPLPDLLAFDLAWPDPISVGQPIVITWKTTNIGEIHASSPWLEHVAIIASPRDESPLAALGGVVAERSLGPSDVVDRQLNVTVPQLTGPWYLRLDVDSNNQVGEAVGEFNNVLVGDSAVTPLWADLAVDSIVAPSSISNTVPFSLTWSVLNDGAGDAWAGMYFDRVYLSTDGVIDTKDLYLGQASHPASPQAAGRASPAALNVQLDESVPAGSYFILVVTDVLGDCPESNEKNNTAVEGPIELAAPPRPDLVVTSITLPTTGEINSTETIAWTIANQGDAATTGSWYDRVYFSSDSVTGGDTVAATIEVTATIEAGASQIVEADVTLPESTGTIWAIVVTDINDDIDEYDNRDNNTTVSGSSIEVVYPPLPDLVLTSVEGPPSAVVAGSVAIFDWTTENNGDAEASGYWRDWFYLSQDGVLDAGDLLIGSTVQVGPIVSGGTLSANVSFELPTQAIGFYYVLVQLDAEDDIFEGDNEDNNVGVSASMIEVLPAPFPDLTIETVTSPTEAEIGAGLIVSWLGRNVGEGESPSSWSDAVYLSEDQAYSSEDVLLGTRLHIGTVASGATWTEQLSVAVPDAEGTWWVITVADSNDTVEEAPPGSKDASNESTSVLQIVILPPPRPDLLIEPISWPETLVAGDVFEVAWRVTNAGRAATEGGWSDEVRLLDVAVPSPSDQVLRVQPYNAGALEPGEFYERIVAVQMPVDFEGGDRYLFFETDTGDTLDETNEDNNEVVAGPIAVSPTPAPDISVAKVSAKATAVFGEEIALSWTLLNSGDAVAGPAWSDGVLLSADAIISSDDVILHAEVVQANIEPGETHLVSTTVELPLSSSLQPGTWYVLILADAANNLDEPNEDDNSGASAAIEISLPSLPDLSVAVSGMPKKLDLGEQFELQLVFTNNGKADLEGNWFTSITVKDSDDPSDDGILLQDFITSGPLLAGESTETTRTVGLPALDASTIDIVVCADSRSSVVETDDDNCVIAGTATFSLPDLVLVEADAPETAVAGQEITISYTVRNDGTGVAYGYWSDAMRLSLDVNVGDDRTLGYQNVADNLAPGATYSKVTTVTVPDSLEGNYHLVIALDSQATLLESDEANTHLLLGESVFVTQPDRPDLVVTSVSAPTVALVGQTVEVSYIVMNQGEQAADGAWSDRVAASANGVLSAADPTLANILRTRSVPSNGSYSETVSVQMPAAPGNWYIFIAADENDSILEPQDGGETNNIRSTNAPILVGGVNVAVSAQEDVVEVGQDVHFSGYATIEGTATAAAGVPVQVVAVVRGLSFSFGATTDSSGNFAVIWTPLETQAGLCSVAARALGGTTTPAQDELAIWGLGTTWDNDNNILLPENGATSKELFVRNLGDLPMTGLEVVEVNTDIPGLAVEASVLGGSNIAPGETRGITILVSSQQDGEAEGSLWITVQTDQIANRTLEVSTAIGPAQSSLVVSPSTIDAAMVVGETTFVQLTIRNEGLGSTGLLSVELAQAEWLGLVTPVEMPVLLPGHEAVIILGLTPDEDLALGPYTASPALVVTDSGDPTVGIGVDATFEAVSTAICSIDVRLADEFTFYGDSESQTDWQERGASVTLVSQATGEVMAVAPTSTDGRILFERLPPGYYMIHAEAEKHGDFSGTVLAVAGETTEAYPFMAAQVISYVWNVTESGFEDDYIISLEVQFETNVPAPVLVFEPAFFDFSSTAAEATYHVFTITNHGLVQADDLSVQPVNQGRFELLVLQSDIGDLGPGQSTEVAFLVIDLEFGDDGGVANGSSGCGCSFVSVSWELECGADTQDYSQSVYTYCGCDGAAPWGQGSSGPGGGGGRINSSSGSTHSQDACCTARCMGKIIGVEVAAICMLFRAGEVCAAWNCAQQVYGVSMGTQSDDAAALECLGGLVPDYKLGFLCMLYDMYRACNYCDSFECSPVSALMDWGGFGDASGGFSASGSTESWEWQEPTGAPSAELEFNRALYRYFRIWRPFFFQMGSLDWFGSQSVEDVPAFQAWLGLAFDVTLHTSDGGQAITVAEGELLTGVGLEFGEAGDLVALFIDRWNRSVDYWNQGIETADDLPEGWNPDFIDLERLAAFREDALAVIELATAQGYDSPGQIVQVAVDTLLAQYEDLSIGCVRIALELEQTFAVTRQAFDASLHLTNETDAPTMSISASIEITDAYGESAMHLFEILGPELTGISDVSGTGVLNGGETCDILWTIIPSDSAAPQDVTPYFVSGEFSYMAGDQVAVVRLYPIQINVGPNASLDVQYLLETQVQGDDPFTPELEPTVPFSLGVWVYNGGAGDADAVRIYSNEFEIVSIQYAAEPQDCLSAHDWSGCGDDTCETLVCDSLPECCDIVWDAACAGLAQEICDISDEEDDEILLQFSLLGTQVNGEDVSPSFEAYLGDIAPGEAAVARWLMACSLLGEFTSYSATYQSVNGFDDPEFSIIDSIGISDLLHVVRVDEPIDDGRFDFLANVEVDPGERIPETLFLSTGAVESVSSDLEPIVQVNGDETVTVSALTGTGWRYIRLDDPYNGSRPIESVTRADGKQLLMDWNVWQSDWINHSASVPEAMRRVHILDRGIDADYVLTFSQDGEPPAVLAWTSIPTITGGAPASQLTLPLGVPTSDSRAGGIRRLVATVSEPLDPASIWDGAVAVAGDDLNGDPVDLSSTTWSVTPVTGDVGLSIVFEPPLPERGRYCIQLIGVTDLSGNLLHAEYSRLDIASLPGDASGDLRVNATDGGGVSSLLGITSIDPDQLYEVRSDIDFDGDIDQADLDIVVANRPADASWLANVCSFPLTASGKPRPELLTLGGLLAARGPRTEASSGPASWAALAEQFDRDQLDSSSDDENAKPVKVEVIRWTTNGQEIAAPVLMNRIAVRGEHVAINPETLLEDFGAVWDSAEPLTGDGWWWARLPEHLANAESHASLAAIFVAQGFEVSPVVVVGTETVAVVGGDILVHFGAMVPDDWCDRVVQEVSPGAQRREHALARVDHVELASGFGGDAIADARVFGLRTEVAWSEPNWRVVALGPGHSRSLGIAALDPTILRWRELRADLDQDGDIDGDDLELMAMAALGNEVAHRYDLNGDGAVDMVDFAWALERLTLSPLARN